MMRAQKAEELLETIFTQREEGRDDVASILEHTNEAHAEGKCAEDFLELEGQGLVGVDGERVWLTPLGEEKAVSVVRRHRLAERLFTDLFELSPREVESQACEFEHVLSPEATDSVCALLGHPPACPHGKPIPAGACCKTSKAQIAPVVTSLEHLPLGAVARVVFLASRAPGRVSRLLPFGVAPGSEVRLRQRSPAYVLEVGETTLALEREVAREVFVKRLGGG
jgi:DtxR family Mn-dependent transcriptional regulator